MARAWPPAAQMPSTVSRAVASLTSTTTTVAPSRAKTSAVPLPTPDPAPVITAILPASRPLMMPPLLLLAAHVDTDVLHLRVAPQRFQPFFASKPALAVAAEWHLHAASSAIAVDKDLASADAARHAMRLGHVARPHGGHQAIRRAIGQANRLLLVPERRDGHDGTEDLLLEEAT